MDPRSPPSPPPLHERVRRPAQPARRFPLDQRIERLALFGHVPQAQRLQRDLIRRLVFGGDERLDELLDHLGGLSDGGGR
jgi:hypothetical protein